MSKVTHDTSGLARFRRALRPETEQAVSDTTTAVQRLAQATVRVDTGELRESIEKGGSGLSQDVHTDAAHASAQEFGRPDLANYGYTPYLKPSAEAERERHKERCKAAIRRAIR